MENGKNIFFLNRKKGINPFENFIFLYFEYLNKQVE